ncbi:cytochrome P450 [Anopheles darlingi]|uniref:Cytochrome P450 n=1 Tax=Anopheles darlingi TaxID=43151 RepID=W5JPL9_ANODA|nr:cytochrome P450 [Anopheles darlingi]
MERHGGKITYENIQELKYLDLCVKETLRKYPGLPILTRECTQDYRIPESDVVVRRGTQVLIPLLTISMDEKYFPDPEQYSPERFDEETRNYDPDAYYPFGAGPRNCIGIRQGILQTKIGLIIMLSRFNFYATIPAKIKFEGSQYSAPSSSSEQAADCGVKVKMFVYTLALVALVIFLGLKYIYSYWDRHGVSNIKPNIPYGNLKTVAERKESFGIAINNLYQRSTERLVGVYLFFRPSLIIRDPYLAKRIMVADFQHFHDRGVYCNEHRDPFSANLFALPGQRWKNLRAKLTPTFTSGQLRNMMPTFMAVGQKLQAEVERLVEEPAVHNVRALMSRFVIDVIASVFFGFESNCIQDPRDPFFVTLTDLVRAVSFINNVRSAGVFVCPALLKLTRLSSLPPEVIKFVKEIITYQIEHRERNDVARKDFLQLLIDLRREAGENKEEKLSIEQCAANVFLFYVAGAETSTATASFTLHELTHNPDVMVKVRQEIDEMLERNGGKITYENIKELKYLDLCVKETLRKYPGLPILNRECTQDYRVPESDMIIRKGTQVIIPLLAISMDEKYFPDPEQYSPERFDEETRNYDPDAYYPFGAGPRNCIGLRQGVLVAKIGLILMLSKFNFEATLPRKIVFEAATVPLAPHGGLPMRISRRVK